MPATYDSIASTTLGSATASVTFSSLSSSYTDIIAVIQCGTSANTQENIAVQVGNGSADTGSNYSRTILYGDGSSAVSSRSSSQTSFGVAVGAVNNTVKGMNIIQFMNYANTTTNKTMLARGGDPSLYDVASVGLWRSTSAINTIKFSLAGGNNFVTGSVFTLYGIKAA